MSITIRVIMVTITCIDTNYFNFTLRQFKIRITCVIHSSRKHSTCSALCLLIVATKSTLLLLVAQDFFCSA